MLLNQLLQPWELGPDEAIAREIKQLIRLNTVLHPDGVLLDHA